VADIERSDQLGSTGGKRWSLKWFVTEFTLTPIFNYPCYGSIHQLRAEPVYQLEAHYGIIFSAPLDLITITWAYLCFYHTLSSGSIVRLRPARYCYCLPASATCPMAPGGLGVLGPNHGLLPGLSALGTIRKNNWKKT
jgi:hypothetical protein